MHAADIPTACENCATVLQGPYCHACGQHGANPLRHFGHAVEDVFESFWHLDGRVFRTMRDLFVPGRVACNYLAGQRVRYIAPLRLFVILTLVTFFIGRLMAGSVETRPRTDAVDARRGATAEPANFRSARTPAEVDAELRRELADLAEARREAGGVPFMGTALDAAERDIRAAATRRRAELARMPPAAPATPAPPGRGDASAPTAPLPAGTAPPVAAAREAGSPKPAASAGADAAASGAGRATQATAPGREGVDGVVRELDSARLRDPSKPWHETDNPADVSWLPAFGDRWFNRRLANLQHNIERLENGGDARMFGQYLLAAVPSALFLLVPVFALLLRLLYPRSRWGYLEHLVVALYSHCYLLVTLGLTFALLMLVDVSSAFGVPIALLWAWAPVYLFVMQRRVYGQHWLATVAKFAVIGFLYQFLIVGAAVYSVFASLTSAI